MFAPVVLHARGVRLEPLSLSHVAGLIDASTDGDLSLLHFTSVPAAEPDATARYIQAALDGQAHGAMLPFAVLDDTGRVLGSTRFYDINPSVPTAAIGYTWYRASVQRSHVNTTCKRLLLGHAFDVLKAQSVMFHTSHQNLRSQAAIERLGAQRDGILRNHMRHKDGSLRDTYAYSIIASEWPAIRDRLDARLAAG